MLQRFERVIFFLVIFFLPFQVGKHFWPDFSFVGGLRVDYLSPTIYLTDIFVILLLGVVIIRWIRGVRRIRRIRVGRRELFFLIFLLLVLFPFSFASSPEAVIFGIFKFLEFSFFAVYVSQIFSVKDKNIFIDSISIGAIVASFISIAQFFKQGSIGNFLYFLGERTFTVSTIGIAKMNLDGSLLLRPYSTFPHPNILAFFLFMVIVFVCFRLKHEKDLHEKIFLMSTLLISTTALLLTFSRTIIICYLLFMIYYLITRFSKSLIKFFIFLVPALLVLSVYFNIFSSRFFHFKSLWQDLVPRQDLLNIAFQIFKESPVVGVGVNNFFIHEISYQKIITSTLLQPVHNIYVLVLVEMGFLGLLGLLGFLGRSIWELKKRIRNTKKKEFKDFYRGVLILVMSIMFIGLFDHFFLTLQQGQLMLAMILGFAWSDMKIQKSKLKSQK